MLQRNEIVGHRIKTILADGSYSDDAINFVDFIMISASGNAFRLPCEDESDDWLPLATPTSEHRTVRFPISSYFHYRKRLWGATVEDILIPKDPDLRFPDSARVQLSSGWYIIACSGAPLGIVPGIDIFDDISTDEEMVSVWSIEEA